MISSVSKFTLEHRHALWGLRKCLKIGYYHIHCIVCAYVSLNASLAVDTFVSAINTFNCICSCGNVSTAFILCLFSSKYTQPATTVNANKRAHTHTHTCRRICVCVCICVCVLHVPNADDWQCAASVQDVTAPLCKQCSNAARSSLGAASPSWYCQSAPTLPPTLPSLLTLLSLSLSLEHLWRYDASPAMRTLSF